MEVRQILLNRHLVALLRDAVSDHSAMCQKTARLRSNSRKQRGACGRAVIVPTRASSGGGVWTHSYAGQMSMSTALTGPRQPSPTATEAISSSPQVSRSYRCTRNESINHKQRQDACDLLDQSIAGLLWTYLRVAVGQDELEGGRVALEALVADACSKTTSEHERKLTKDTRKECGTLT